MAQFRQQIRGRHVHGSVVRGASGAVGEEAGDDAGVDAAGEGERREAGFGREGVSREPGEEGGGAEEACVWELGCVRVRVDEAGEEEGVGAAGADRFGGGPAWW